MSNIFRRKGISIFLMIAFFAVVCFPFQGHTDQVMKTEKQEAFKKAEAEFESSELIEEYYSRDDANVIEDEGYPGGKKKKKFPWLLVVGGAVVVGVVLYFLVVKKPKYDLTVSVGEGIAATPAAGTYSYKKGKSVSYSFSLQSGYSQLTVKLDGATVGAGGTVTMDQNHTISATCLKQGSLRVTSNPQSAAIFLDGSNKGKTNRTIENLDPGSYTVKLTKDGYEDYETTATVEAGQQTTVNATMFKLVNGKYQGTTNQNYPVSLTVQKQSGKSVLTNYQIKMKSRVNVYGYYITTTITGTTSKTITNYKFSLTGTYCDLDGTFSVNGTTTVAGTWDLHYHTTFYGSFYGEGTYNAAKVSSPAPAADRAFSKLKPGEVKITTEIMKDGRLIKRLEK